MKIISVLNMKGGVAKTTTSVNLAAGLSRKGKRVLIIDADSQGNSTRFFMPNFKNLDMRKFNEIEVSEKLDIRNATEIIRNYIKENLEKKNINNLLLSDGSDIHECIYKTDYENLDIIPSLGTELIKTEKLLSITNGLTHKRLKKALREVRHEYDVVIIDNAPTFNNITVNSLFASNEVIIPLKPSMFELDGLVNTLLEVFEFEDEYECEYTIRLLMNMIPRGNRPSYINFIEKMKDFYPDNIIETTIGYQDAVASKSTMTATLLIDSKSKVGQDYLNLIDELIKTM